MMVKKVLKGFGILVASIVLLLVIAYTVVYFGTNARANKVYSVRLQQLVIPDDSTSYEAGKHTAAIRGCLECHGANIGGKVFSDDKSPVAVLYAANLTTGKGGINYTDQDWVRALRHGLNKQNKSVWFMPSQHTSSQLSNNELASLICYLKKQPAVDNEQQANVLKPLGRVLTYLNKYPLFTAEFIDHNAKFSDMVKVEVSPAYGKYLAISCSGCHGENYKGSPPHEPGQPPIPNLTSTGNVGKWTEPQFAAALRTGNTPDGRLLSDYMPWKVFGKASTDDELHAIYLYLQSLK
ncbi:hypothetical protein BH10BAC3_BH10BAC3_40110 [soil metagenome]